MINDDYADAAMEAEFAEDEDIRRAALGFISDAWAEAIANGVDADAASAGGGEHVPRVEAVDDEMAELRARGAR